MPDFLLLPARCLFHPVGDVILLEEQTLIGAHLVETMQISESVPIIALTGAAKDFTN